MSRLHVMLYAIVEGESEPVIETKAFEGTPEAIGRKLAGWLAEQSKGLRGELSADDGG